MLANKQFAQLRRGRRRGCPLLPADRKKAFISLERHSLRRRHHWTMSPVLTERCAHRVPSMEGPDAPEWPLVKSSWPHAASASGLSVGAVSLTTLDFFLATFVFSGWGIKRQFHALLQWTRRMETPRWFLLDIFISKSHCSVALDLQIRFYFYSLPYQSDDVKALFKVCIGKCYI